VEREQSRHTIHQGGFAGTIWPEQAEPIPGCYFKIYLLKTIYGCAGIPETKIMDSDSGIAH
jgi:hypothetical protein